MIWLLLGCSWLAPTPSLVHRNLDVDADGHVVSDALDLGGDGHIERRSTYVWQGDRLTEMRQGEAQHSWSYDAQGRPETYTERMGTQVVLTSSFDWEDDRLTDIRTHNGKGAHAGHQRFRYGPDGRLQRWLLLDGTGKTTDRRSYTWADRSVTWTQDTEQGRCAYDEQGRPTLYAYRVGETLRQQVRFTHGEGTRTRVETLESRPERTVVERYTTDATGSRTGVVMTSEGKTVYEARIRIHRPHGGDTPVAVWSETSAAPLPGQPPTGTPELPHCPAWSEPAPSE